MNEDKIGPGYMRLHDKGVDRSPERLLSINIWPAGISFHTADWQRDRMGPDIWLGLDQLEALRDWLTDRIEEMRGT